MSTQPNGNPFVYDVKFSEKDKAALKQKYREAIQTGRGKQFVAALRVISDRLRTDPLSFGEPLFRLPALGLSIRQAAVAPLIVDYGVHEERRLVFIRGFTALS